MKNSYHLTVIIILLTVAISCGKMDSVYRDYIKNGAINYTGKVDSVKVSPGKNRIQFTYLLRSDPKITRTVIYWNDKKDSMVQPVQRTQNVDTITTIIPQISEGAYTFTFITFDDEGSSSVKVDVPGMVYGSNYESSLNHRPLQSTELAPNSTALISWFTADPSMVGVEMEYTGNDDLLKTIVAPASELESLMTDYKSGTTYRYRTLHQPEPGMIDTLYTGYVTQEITLFDVTSLYLANPGNPFEYDSYDGTRFGILKNWTITSNVNNVGGFGSFDNLNDGAYLSISKPTDSDPNVTHGKIFQTIDLPEGDYLFTMYFQGKPDAGYSIAGGTGSRVAAALGASIPNTPSTANSLAFATLSPNTTINFSLASPQKVSLGIWSTVSSSGNYLRAVKVKLTKRV